MAQLKQLVVNGATRLIGTLYATLIQTNKVNAPTTAGGTTYGAGISGQVLKTNGTTVYWGDDNNTTYESKAAASGGTAVSLVTTGEKYTWNNKGTYSKPSDGIPKTDLASAVQTSLGKADSALQSHQTIKQDGVTGATVNRFGTCGTAAGTAAKTVSITTGTFSLEAGTHVTVKFTNANTASNPTLNVNSSGAKNIFHKGSQITTSANKEILAGTVDFVYDGTQWHLVGTYLDTDNNVKNVVNTTTKYYMAGTATASTNTGTQIFDTGIYSTTTAGQLNATTYKVNEAVTMQYNSTTECLDFIFA